MTLFRILFATIALSLGPFTTSAKDDLSNNCLELSMETHWLVDMKNDGKDPTGNQEYECNQGLLCQGENRLVGYIQTPLRWHFNQYLDFPDACQLDAQQTCALHTRFLLGLAVSITTCYCPEFNVLKHFKSGGYVSDTRTRTSVPCDGPSIIKRLSERGFHNVMVVNQNAPCSPKAKSNQYTCEVRGIPLNKTDKSVFYEILEMYPPPPRNKNHGYFKTPTYADDDNNQEY